MNAADLVSDTDTHLIAELLGPDLGRLLCKGVAVCCMHVPSLFCFQPLLVRAIFGDQNYIQASFGVVADPVGGGMLGYPVKGPGGGQLDLYRHLADVEAAALVTLAGGHKTLGVQECMM